jgi:hypothetical protein
MTGVVSVFNVPPTLSHTARLQTLINILWHELMVLPYFKSISTKLQYSHNLKTPIVNHTSYHPGLFIHNRWATGPTNHNKPLKLNKCSLQSQNPTRHNGDTTTRLHNHWVLGLYQVSNHHYPWAWARARLHVPTPRNCSTSSPHMV